MSYSHSRPLRVDDGPPPPYTLHDGDVDVEKGLGVRNEVCGSFLGPISVPEVDV